MSQRFQWLVERLQASDRQSLRRRLIPQRMDGPYLIRDQKRLVNFGSNDYLGIAAERLVDSEPIVGYQEHEVLGGAGSSPLVCGFSPLHSRLVDDLAKFEETESAVLYPSGFAACSGTISALAEAGDLILSDELNHASLIDGCRLSRAERFIYPHCDLAAVKSLLQNHRHRFNRVFLLTDSIFSMDGTCAPLAALVDLADRFDAIMVVDEAHGTGVCGSSGSGACEAWGVKQRVPIRIGTLSKAIGAQGGFVCGPQIVCDYLLQTSRPLIYSTAAPPTTILKAIKGLQIIREQPERRQRLQELTRHLIAELVTAGLIPRAAQHGEGTPFVAPIVPVRLPSNEAVLAVSRYLESAGFYVPAIRPPTVATPRLRISINALHQDDIIESLVASLNNAAVTWDQRPIPRE